MKKLLALLLALVMVFSLCACGGSEEVADDGDDEKEEAESTESTDPDEKEEPKDPAASGAEMVDVWVIKSASAGDTNVESNFKYDANGNLIEVSIKTDGYYGAERYSYDSAGRKIARYSYVDASDMPEITEAWRCEELNAYDIYGNEVECDMGYGYDEKGNIVFSAGFVASGEACETVYSYDNTGKLIKTEAEFTNLDTNATNTIITTYTYDEKGNLIAEKDNEGYQTTYAYDDKGRLVEEKYILSDGTVFETTTYTYDENGGIKQINYGEATIQFTCEKISVPKALVKAIEEQQRDVAVAIIFL